MDAFLKLQHQDFYIEKFMWGTDNRCMSKKNPTFQLVPAPG